MSILDERWTDDPGDTDIYPAVRTKSGQYVFVCTLESVRRHIIELHNKQVEEES